jgi:photosystem II stability/assembly factor-like uncharacterized protein
MLLLFTLLIGESAFPQQITNRTVSAGNFLTVSFSDSLNGWIGGYPSLLIHTTDGGLNWSNDPLFDSLVRPSCSWVKSISPQETWIIWYDQGYNLVSKQDTRQHKWDTLFAIFTGHICVHEWRMAVPLDTARTWLAGSSTSICSDPLPFIKTNDGGTTWQDAGLHPRNDYGGQGNYFAALDVTKAYVFVLTSGRIIHRSSVDSTLWQADTLSSTSQYLNDLSFGGLNAGWVCGKQGDLFHTTDAGNSWLPQHINTAQNLTAICAIDSEYAWTIGDSGAVFRTTDGGAAWDSVLSVRPKANALSFPDRNHGWIVGDSGVIVQYNNGVITSVGNTKVLPSSFELFQNYPNPFNPSTTIGFELSHSTFVTIKVFNILGEEIATLVTGELPAGKHTKQWDASGFASGVYFYQMRAGNMIQTRKLILVR